MYIVFNKNKSSQILKYIFIPCCFNVLIKWIRNEETRVKQLIWKCGFLFFALVIHCGIGSHVLSIIGYLHA